MKRIVFIIVCISLIAISPAAAGATGCYVYVRGIIGTVEVLTKGDSDWDDADLDQCLSVGDKIRTGDDGKVMLDFSDRADIRLNSLTEMEISKQDAAAEKPDQAFVAKGQAWTKVQKADAPFSVKTPSAIAGVRGTEFDVDVDDQGNADVNVTEGEVSVSNERGESIARAGMMAHVFRGKRPEAPRRFNLKEHLKKLAGWKDKIEKGKELNRKRLHGNNKKKKGKNKKAGIDNGAAGTVEQQNDNGQQDEDQKSKAEKKQERQKKREERQKKKGAGGKLR